MSTEDELHDQLDAIAARMARSNDEIQNIERSYGSDPQTMPEGQAERYRNTSVALTRSREEYDEVERKLARYGEIRRNASAGYIDGAQSDHDAPHRRVRRADPWKSEDESGAGFITRAHESLGLMSGPQDSDRNRIAAMLDGSPGEASDFARYVIRTGDPDYKSAWLKRMRDPQHGHILWSDEERYAWHRVYNDPVIRRTAMSLTDANGGFLVPFTLDPTVILTNSSAQDPMRMLANNVTITTDTWNGVSSAGVTAEWTGEGTEWADASPTFAQPTITPKKADAWLQGSYEVLADSAFATQMSKLMADAKMRLEAAAFATGNTGATQPRGIVAATAAVTASIVTSAAINALAVGDVYNLDSAITPRARGNVSFIAAHGILNKLRTFDTAGGSAFWSNLNNGLPPNLLGSPVYEVSNMQNAVTTSGLVLLGGNIREAYTIVDRVGMSVLFDPIVLGSNRRPSGQAGYAAYWRVGADVVNVDLLRVLSLHTTATAVALG